MTPKRRIFPIFIPHVGCEHDCVFCDQRRITGTFIPAVFDDVLAALHSLWCEQKDRVKKTENGYVDAAESAELAFYGGSFTAIAVERQNELLTAAQPFLRLNPFNSIRVSTRPDCLDEGAAKRLRSYGVATVELGAQSMCDDVLQASGRGHTAESVTRSAAMVKAAGFSLILQMMTGLPGDSREKSLYTAKCLAAMAPDYVRIYPTVVIKGTRLHEMWKTGSYIAPTVDDAVHLCVAVCTVFDTAGIPVIRLGLNPTDYLSSGDAVAGAYHPAFGELVYSAMYLAKAESALRDSGAAKDVVITVPRGQVSRMTGYRRQNVCALKQNFRLNTLKIVESDIKQGEIIVEIKP